MKLLGGSDTSHGNVYFFNRPVCDDGWSIEDGNVTCRELGFPGAESVTTASFFGPAYSEFSASNVQCNGDELRLEDCPRKDETQTYCTMKEVAGVYCKTEDRGKQDLLFHQ